ncbi:hypothetical protein PFISCL1PPCAC_19231 [Pristionchus fissidentatus]|uniref:BTB domain-containing protein n=1 Tax=Pristionchus fissidentatus TaxID=1538716 RepID=A0AAV5W7I0_9BILA|nr:hypothetical protein PFISCL1PPCAC_19231 [Pristionchus fissidentatus]
MVGRKRVKHEIDRSDEEIEKEFAEKVARIEELEREAVVREAKIAELENGQKASTSSFKASLSLKNNNTPSRDPTATHLVQLPNGKRVVVNMHFDINKWSLHRVDQIEYLEDLCFVFDSNNEESTHFVVKIGDRRYDWFDCHSISGRFRVGSILSTLTGEKEVLFQCNRRLETAESIDTIEVSINIRQYDKSYFEMCRNFLSCCGRKGIEVVSNKTARATKLIIFPSQEILSLHSPYFLNIFYGDFCEKQQEIIRIPAISNLSLRRAMLYSSGFKLRPELFVDLLGFFDRFSFVDSLNRLKIEAAERALELPLKECRMALEIVDHLQDETTLNSFIGRFVTTDCLHELMRENVDVISKETMLCLTKRMADIATILHRRPKIRFCFPEGEVLVSLFNDIRPRTIRSLISLIRSKQLEFFEGSRMARDSTTKFAFLPYLSSLVDEPEEEKTLTLPLLSHPLSLYYCHKNPDTSVLFFHRSPLQYAVMGTVVSGSEIVSIATVLTSIAVE